MKQFSLSRENVSTYYLNIVFASPISHTLNFTCALLCVLVWWHFRMSLGDVFVFSILFFFLLIFKKQMSNANGCFGCRRNRPQCDEHVPINQHASATVDE